MVASYLNSRAADLVERNRTWRPVDRVNLGYVPYVLSPVVCSIKRNCSALISLKLWLAVHFCLMILENIRTNFESKCRYAPLGFTTAFAHTAAFSSWALDTCYEWIFRTGLGGPSGWQSWTSFLVAKFFKKLWEKSRHGTAEFPPSNMYRNQILILTH